MGVSLQEYRSRIGRFMPKMVKTREINLETNYEISDKLLLRKIPKRLSFLLISSVILIYALSINPTLKNEQPTEYFTSTLKPMKSLNPVIVSQPSAYMELSNFYARYTNGNRQARGIKIAHFNKGSGHLQINHLTSECEILYS